MTNPETELTKVLRAALETRGAYVRKLAGTMFQRGIPDLWVVTDRLLLVELKVTTTVIDMVSFKALGLSGLQDEALREATHRVPLGACCVAGTKAAIAGSTQDWGLYTPLEPLNRRCPYVLRAHGLPEVLAWLTGRPT